MIKHQFPKLDNRGASLLMVIIGLAFVAALGAIVVSAALMNNEMKAVDRKSKYNFYSAEAAMDEIKTGLEEDTANSLSTAYQAVMTRYLSMNDTMRKNLFHEKFVCDMMTALDVNLASNAISLTKLNLYLKETRKIAPSADGAEVIGTPVLDSASSNDFIILRGIKVSYQKEGFTTLLTTDIKINIPKEAQSTYFQKPYLEYALIADEALYAKFTDNNITGNVYAGSGGINTGLGKKMIIKGNRIISKGDITVKDLGELTISGSETEVWANNLVTTQTDKESETSYETLLSILGNCFMKDDLVLDAKRSKVIIGGNYYGYSSGNKAESNSSIIINAPNANLDLSGLGKLYLAGRSFISLEDGAGAISYMEDSTYGLNTGANCNILTGESLAIKGSQNAYLLPSEFIAVGHNPVSWSEYKAYYDAATELMAVIPSDAVVFDKEEISEDERRLLYYLDDTCPVKKAFYKFGANDNVVYYYLNFKSQELATAYFKNYMRCYPGKIYNGFPIGSIKINHSPGACITAGNMMTYDTMVKLTSGTNSTFLNNYLSTFANLTSTLHKNNSGTGDPNNNIVFENILDLDKLKAAGATHPDGKIIEKELLIGGESYYICIIDNETSVAFPYDKSGKKGIIVATGDISMNRDFTGLVISNGTIELNAGTITADSEAADRILSADSDTAAYFKAYKASEAGSFHVADLIEYENWKKN